MGNRPAGSLGDTPVPVSGGSVAGAGRVMDEGSGAVVDVADDATTTSAADPVNESAPEAVAFAEIRTCSPAVACDFTATVLWSSSAWPTGMLPTLQVVPLADGQTVNFGLPMSCADAT